MLPVRDFRFEDFIDVYMVGDGFPSLVIVELDKLRKLLNEYESKASDEEIINDPAWSVVVEQANAAIREWDSI